MVRRLPYLDVAVVVLTLAHVRNIESVVRKTGAEEVPQGGKKIKSNQILQEEKNSQARNAHRTKRLKKNRSICIVSFRELGFGLASCLFC